MADPHLIEIVHDLSERLARAESLVAEHEDLLEPQRKEAEERARRLELARVENEQRERDQAARKERAVVARRRNARNPLLAIVVGPDAKHRRAVQSCEGARELGIVGTAGIVRDLLLKTTEWESALDEHADVRGLVGWALQVHQVRDLRAIAAAHGVAL